LECRTVCRRTPTEHGWGESVIPWLAKDIRDDLPKIKGFSERYIERMLAFYRKYNVLDFSPTPSAKLAERTIMLEIAKSVTRLHWARNVALLKIKDIKEGLWYMQKILEHGWRMTFSPLKSRAIFLALKARRRQEHSAYRNIN
jgi:hypothetical protein